MKSGNHIFWSAASNFESVNSFLDLKSRAQQYCLLLDFYKIFI